MATVTVHDAVDRIDVDAVNSKEKRELYKAREPIFPKKVTGRFRTAKWWIMAVTLGIYYVTPWLRWDRGPFAPDQAVLIDIANSRFYFFFIEIWPQEFFFVAGLLIMAGVGLFLITSTVGRAWCGYTCPQTVWVDLFLVVERMIDGDRNAQIKLAKTPWTADKVVKRTVKHSLWLVIAMATGGAWIFYFADAPTLAIDFVTGEASHYAYITVGILTATTYGFGGHMREQVCTYMCPWPRIQAAMLDEHSMVVTYNDWRGEPRSRHKKAREAEPEQFGDCIDCNQCVAVCPMGIDIRDGQQLECITCALCIDACDNVMDKVGSPRGLISYSTLHDYERRAAGESVRHDWTTIFRTRTLIYFGAWSLIGLVMLLALFSRDRLDLSVLHDRNPVFVQLSDGSVRNGYTLKISNMLNHPRSFAVELEGLPGAAMSLASDEQPPRRRVEIDVPANELRSVKLYVTQEQAASDSARQSFDLLLHDLTDGERADYRAIFNRPEP
ncbi:MAG: cytochrome c oxidase accessory protein CcoG [Geminicoccaceae bacterium]